MTAMNKAGARMLAGRAKRYAKEIYGRRIRAAGLSRPTGKFSLK